MEKMKNLLSPMRIGNLVVKNRMVMGPMNTNFTNENGAISIQLIEYFAERAKNGVGMFVIEAASVVSNILNHGVQPLLTDENLVPGWFNLVDSLHGYGAKVSIELVHYGSEGQIGPRVSASAISHYKGEVEILTVKEIKAIEDKFVDAALRAKQADFDAITLHAAHGYLLAEFLSPAYNKRTDEYGGSLENRTRILTEIIEKCQRVLGSNYPIMVRFSVDEFINGGRGLEESKKLAQILEKVGVAALDLSAGVVSTYMFSIRPNNMDNLEGFLVPYSKEIKSVVDIPVICAGGMREPEKMEEIIRDKAADMITLGRALLADQEFCKKVSDGNVKEIKTCLSCQECLATLNSGKSVRCAINPKTGREYLWKEMKVDSKQQKKILVAGAGPAGMEAALTLRKAGHQVTLCDKEQELGGTMRAAAVPPGKHRIKDLINWYDNQLKKEKVEIRMGCFYEEIISNDSNWDTIVFAIGASYMRRIPGSIKEHVITAVEALLHPEKVGETVVIIGGGASGAEVAEYFSKEVSNIHFTGMSDIYGSQILYTSVPQKEKTSRHISIVEMRDIICADMYEDNATLMRIRVKEYGVKEYVEMKVEEIGEKSIILRNMLNQERLKLDADTIILAAGLIANGVSDCYKGKSQVIAIGDSNCPGKIKDAIYAGSCVCKMI